ncbi:hypothetical protein FACS189474_0860 [Bacteroidia bacterium]|nr:hypothetical protein FACS189423_06990 [Bacteroidia bacterium]GHT87620.1 hypothetical protein FACS189474_0860 [Bacteroidia bacterium]
MKKSLSIPLLLVVFALGLVSCLDTGNGGNSSTFTIPGVVSSNPLKGGLTLLTVGGEFATPQLSTGSDVLPGDCVIASLTIDLDNQPSKDYFTATNVIVRATVDQSIVDIREDTVNVEEFFPVDSIFPIKDLLIEDYDPILKGKFFLQIAHNTSIRQEIAYKMVAVQKNVPSNQEVTDVYLIAKKGGATTTSISEAIHAFDILTGIYTLGKDTTVKISSTIEEPVKLLTVNLKYCSEVKDGKPVYTNYKPSSSPLKLAVYTKY